MPLDFQEVRRQIQELAEQAPEQKEKKLDLLEKAKAILEAYKDANALLQDKVGRAANLNPNFRCAVPTDEALTKRFSEPQLSEQGITLITADGSQINPSRHFDIQYCLVNIGAIIVKVGSTETPQPIIKSTLFGLDQISDLNESEIALIRDQRERAILADLAQKTEGNVITIADGPLELWSREHGLEETEDFKKYLAALDQLRERNAVTGGYVDKPFSDRVVRLLELAVLDDNQLSNAGKNHWLKGIVDADLYKTLLKPGERSAIFRLQSIASQYYIEENSIHFFYLNVSNKENKTNIARVDIPAWVVKNREMLNDLHAILVQQCSILNNAYYPYYLHRAHETALVSFAEKRQLDMMISVQLNQIPEKSQKQLAKDTGYY